MLSLSKGLEINTAEVSLSLCSLRAVTDNHPPIRGDFLLSGAHLSICFLFSTPVSPPYLQSLLQHKAGLNHARHVLMSQMFKVIITVDPFRSLFLFLFPCLLLPQIAFHFTEWLLLHYQRKGSYTCAMSCYLKDCSVCRPYHGSLFWTHKSLLTDTVAVASQPKEWWNSIRTYWKHCLLSSQHGERVLMSATMTGHRKNSLKRLI